MKSALAFSSRLAHIQSIVKEQNLHALLVSTPENIAYLTGFGALSASDREAFLLIIPSDAHMLLLASTSMGLFSDHAIPSLTLHQFSRENTVSDMLKAHLPPHAQIGFDDQNLTVAELTNLQKNTALSFRAAAGLIETMREQKEQEELTSIKEAARITDTVFTTILGNVTTGISEYELAWHITQQLTKTAALAFPPIVAFGKNAAIPHYTPSPSTRLTKPTLILLDFGARVDGYCADLTRMVFFGPPEKEALHWYKTVCDAQKAALAAVKPGVTGDFLDTIARSHITSCGLPAYTHGLGHGVGLAIHEQPRIRKEGTQVLQKNMVVTIEPGIYIENRGGVRIEDLIVLTQNGYTPLSRAPKDIDAITITRAL